MALRREDLTPEQLERQQGYDRSWADLQLVMGDPEKREYLQAMIRKLDEAPPARRLSPEEFDALAERIV